MSRLPISKRNAIIDDFHNGIQDPDYEVIPSKNTKGRYTVRKRKQETVEDNNNNEEVPIQLDKNKDTEEPPNIEQAIENPEVDDQSNSMFNPIAYLQEYQLQVNKLLIEQMKALRVSNKYMMKKQTKYKNRQKQIRDIFADIANKPEAEEEQVINGPLKEQHAEEHEEEVNEEPKNTTSYFENNYENTTPVKEVEYQTPPPPIETPQYVNDYEEELDNLAGPRYVSSRRNRIKAFI